MQQSVERFQRALSYKHNLIYKDNADTIDYVNLNFEDRMKNLLKRSKLSKITVVENKNEQVIAYCMSIIDKTNSGEITTLYVEEEYRRMNIGKNLLQFHIGWF